MSGIFFELLPAARREDVRAGVKSAFGVAEFDALRAVTTGNSGALNYRAEVGGRAYLLRLESQIGGAGGVEAAYRSMGIAADAGVAPPVRYADPAAGIAIVDFLPEKPLSSFPGGVDGLARAIGGLIGRLQKAPLFPAATENYPTWLGRLFAALRGSGLFAEGLLEPHAEAFEHICTVYPWDDARRVSSHNDLHAGNFLFDGDRLWLIDWETGCRNDRYVDVAIALNFFTRTPEQEQILLQAWLGGSPDAMDRARLVLMRALVLIFYASAPNGLPAALGSALETDLSAPTPAEFWAEVEAGQLVLGTADTVVLGRKVALRAFLDRTHAADFEAAISLVATG